MSTYNPRHPSDKDPRHGDSNPNSQEPTPQELWNQAHQNMVIDAEVAKELQQIRSFQVGLYQQSPRLIFTPALLSINIVVFVIMVLSGVSMLSPTPLQVLPWGANHGVLTLNGEAWRLLTCTFLHLGVIHLLVNMYALYVLGPIVERLFQPTGFVVLYLLSGIGGSLASVWWQPLVTSAGASGAIFGVFGGLMGFALRHKNTLPPSIFIQLRNSGMMILVLNIILGMMVSSIDMAGHFGGLAIGFVFAVLASQPVGPEYSRQRFLLSMAAVVVGTGLAILAFFLIPRTAVNDPLQVLQMRQLLKSSASREQERALTRFMRTLKEFRKQEKTLLDQYNQTQGKVATRQITKQEFVRYVLRELYPVWSKMDERFATISLDDLPPAYRQKLTLVLRYVKVRGEHFYAFAKAIETDDAQYVKQSQEKSQEVEKILKILNE